MNSPELTSAKNESGGNLSLLVCNLGTPFSPDYRGAVLALEEVGENFHRIDRMFMQLRNAGILDQIHGLVLGLFTDCKPSDPAKPHLKLPEIFDEVLSWVKAPAVEGFQYGSVGMILDFTRIVHRHSEEIFMIFICPPIGVLFACRSACLPRETTRTTRTSSPARFSSGTP